MESPTYRRIATINSLRKGMPSSHYIEAPMRLILATDSLLIYRRGFVLVALTNVGSQPEGAPPLKHVISNLPHNNGSTLCNAFKHSQHWPWEDCPQVINGRLELELHDGECKLYAPERYLKPDVRTYLSKYWGRPEYDPEGDDIYYYSRAVTKDEL